MISVFNNQFRRIPEDELVLKLIETARPSVALEVAYLSGKKKVIAAVQARIALFRVGRFVPECYEADREFYVHLSRFRIIDPALFLTMTDGKLAIAAKRSSSTKIFKEVTFALDGVFDRISAIKFLPSRIVGDHFEQRKTCENFHKIRRNLGILFNNTLKQSFLPIFKLVNNHLCYVTPEVALDPSPLNLSANDRVMVLLCPASETIEVRFNKQQFVFRFGKNGFKFMPIKKALPIHFLAVRVFAELFYTASREMYTLEVERPWRPLFYAAGLAPHNEKAERRYREARVSGAEFSDSSKGLRKNITFHPSVDDPYMNEKRNRLLADPLLKIIDTDVFKCVFS